MKKRKRVSLIVQNSSVKFFVPNEGGIDIKQKYLTNVKRIIVARNKMSAFGGQRIVYHDSPNSVTYHKKMNDSTSVDSSYYVTHEYIHEQ